MELTRRLLVAVPSLPTGATRSRDGLKTFFLFVAEYGRTAFEEEKGESHVTGILER